MLILNVVTFDDHKVFLAARAMSVLDNMQRTVIKKVYKKGLCARIILDW